MIKWQSAIKYFLLICIGMVLGQGLMAGQKYYEQVQFKNHFVQNDHRSAKVIGGLTDDQREHLA